MKRFGWRWLAASSLLFAILVAKAETRPQYGGTLRVEVQEALASLDPADETQADSLARRNLLSMIFETLVIVDDRGRVHPALATAWHAEPGNQRWQFQIRPGVRFHDGSELTADIAAAALRTANPSWKVFSEGDSLIVECDRAHVDLPAELALARNSIVKRNGGGKLSGTGSFRVEDCVVGKHLSLRAEENYWRGRTFVDAIDIAMGKNFREQLLDLDSGKADLIEVAPEQAQRVVMSGHRVSSSHAVELVALVFANDAQTADEKMMRLALAHSIDRSSMRGALLQGTGDPAACLLPNWMSGYGFSFSTDANLKLARQEQQQVRAAANWTIGYDANDSLSRTITERVALNAHDAGITLRTSAGTNVDMRIMRIPLASADPWIALNNFAQTLGTRMPTTHGDSAEEMYSAEKGLLGPGRVIPLFHLPAEWALSPSVKDWHGEADGRWQLEDTWIGKDRP